MNTIMHIVRKDLRRLAVPLGAWLALVVGKAAALVAYAASAAPWPGDWLGPAFSCANGLEAALGYLLAVLLVLEDSPTDDRAHWRTRPISGGTLLAAKLCGAVSAFVIAPVLALAPVWLAAGFGAGELGLAALDWVCIRGALTLVAVATAAVSGGVGRSISDPVAFVLIAGLGAVMDWTAPGGRAGVLVMTAGAAGLALALQYGARRRRAAILVWTLGSGIAAGGMVWVWWPIKNTNSGAWIESEEGRPLAPGAADAVTGARATFHTESGVTREVRIPTQVDLRETAFDSTLFGDEAGPGPIFRWRAEPDEPAEAQAMKRGQARTASIRVTDFRADLTPGAEKHADWHDRRPNTDTDPNKLKSIP
jgi:hypothetical protein